MYLIGFTPTHQLVSAKSTIASNGNLDIRPLDSEPLDDALDFRPAPCGGVLIRLTQPDT